MNYTDNIERLKILLTGASTDVSISSENEAEYKSLKIPFITELQRVLIHGILHLCGYKDKSTKEEKQMREKENYYLKLSLLSYSLWYLLVVDILYNFLHKIPSVQH